MASVYIVKVGDYLKIGHSGDIQKRMYSFYLNCPYAVELVYHKEYRDSEVSCIVEHAVHARLIEIGYHSRHEWFIGGDAAIAEAKSVLKQWTHEAACNARSLQLEMKAVMAEIRSQRGLCAGRLAAQLRAGGMDSDALFVEREASSKKNRRQISEKALSMAWEYLIMEGKK